MIVKVELPLLSSDPQPKALIHDRYYEIEVLVPITEDLLHSLHGKTYGFFHALIVNGELELQHEAPEQQW